MNLQEGMKAPAFTLPDQSGAKVALSKLKGKWVILYFYPKDMTSGCTKEACEFRDSLSKLKTKNCVVLGVSKDSIKRHVEFSEKFDLNFQLLSDEDGEICEKYGVWQEKSMYGKKYKGIVRSTFIIDDNGRIAKAYYKVRLNGHVQKIVSEVNQLMASD